MVARELRVKWYNGKERKVANIEQLNQNLWQETIKNLKKIIIIITCLFHPSHRPPFPHPSPSSFSSRLLFLFHSWCLIEDLPRARLLRSTEIINVLILYFWVEWKDNPECDWRKILDFNLINSSCIASIPTHTHTSSVCVTGVWWRLLRRSSFECHVNTAGLWTLWR